MKTSIAIGTLLLLAYGNGTQAARVIEIGKRGGLKVERFFGPKYGRAGEWRPATLKADDERIISELPTNDPRRTMPGFRIATPELAQVVQ